MYLGSCGYQSMGCGCAYPVAVGCGFNWFVIIVVLFILLIIVGASCFY